MRRARATGKIIKWMKDTIRRAAMLRAVRNRVILRIMVSVRFQRRCSGKTKLHHGSHSLDTYFCVP